ncbi:hypothetical protein CU098_011130 [Rhizopus stolonifer]|uniref:N-formylglutamate amidohydrolase n=1 Tax=Rhizopus stolonifer TaxID=4846 RepID=A0A367KQP5_RHIST|nr:hypothetical protein CU098_011130 [Rhizopus stolonifer]
MPVLEEYPIVINQGNLPLIITAPHGGLQKPTTIPDRKQEGSLLLADMYTREIAQGIMKGISDHYHENKATPHIIINRIARRKVDVNRPLNEGTESKQGEVVWKEYHHRVQQAIESVKREYGFGIMIDIHGHTHSNEMVELGYLLETNDLTLNIPHLDQLILQKSSIGSLVKRYQDTKQPHQLLYLLGDMLTSYSENKITVVPSTYNPKPQNDMDYFSGGYTTQADTQIHSTE